MVYYDINVQIWREEDIIYYSVIQEFDEEGQDEQVLVYGKTDSMEDAIKTTRAAVIEVLDER